MSTKKVIVGLSGGVDSSVSAYLLQQQGYTVEAVFMQNWNSAADDEHCSVADDRADAERVCERLQIPLHCVNFAQEYWDRVFAYFLSEYRAGRTPNPDVLCNREIKFKAFLDYALNLGADCIATGHYARSRYHNNEWQLLRGLDSNKDQSYFLYLLSQFPLSKTLFPIGELCKPEVRKLAAQLNFITADKKDSTGICFIGERKFKDFLQEYLPAKPGDIVTEHGECIGKHDGLMYHTLGQREGLKIGGRASGSGEAWYVAQKDLATNSLIVVQGKNHPLLFKSSLIAEQMHWINRIAPSGVLHCAAKTRYRQPDEECKITCLGEDKWLVEFTNPQRAVTPGQSLVLYDGEVCLGGGVITNLTPAL